MATHHLVVVYDSIGDKFDDVSLASAELQVTCQGCDKPIQVKVQVQVNEDGTGVNAPEARVYAVSKEKCCGEFAYIEAGNPPDDRADVAVTLTVVGDRFKIPDQTLADEAVIWRARPSGGDETQGFVFNTTNKRWNFVDGIQKKMVTRRALFPRGVEEREKRRRAEEAVEVQGPAVRRKLTRDGHLAKDWLHEKPDPELENVEELSLEQLGTQLFKDVVKYDDKKQGVYGLCVHVVNI